MNEISVNEVSTLEIWPLVVYFGAVIALVLTMLGLSWLLGQARANDSTNDPFESGIVSVGNAQGRISVDFYLIAIFFVIFDLETVFIFAWAIAFFELGWQGYFAMIIFVVILLVALVYEWKSGALEWGVKTRTGLEEDDFKNKLERVTVETKDPNDSANSKPQSEPS